MASHDLEDVIAILNGRESIVNECEVFEKKLRKFLQEEFQKLLSTGNVEEIIACHLPPDIASQQRAGIVLQRINRISM